MPRPKKIGLDYYPADTNRRNDFKIMDLLNEYGPLGYTIYDFCLQYIYTNGYFLNFSIEQLKLSLVKDIGSKWIKNKDLVGQVIDYCAEIDLFDRNLLQQNVMTSVGIQRRYSEVTVRNKVDKSKYWLLAKEKPPEAYINAPFESINVAETQVNVAETPQSKEKESKVKESSNTTFVPPAAKAADSTDDIFISLILNNKSYYDVSTADIRHYKELYPAVDVEQELRFMCGWLESNPTKRKTKSGIKSFITRWLARVQNQGGVRHEPNSSNSQQIPATRQSTRDVFKGETVY